MRRSARPFLRIYFSGNPRRKWKRKFRAEKKVRFAPRKRHCAEDIKSMRIDVWSGMFISNLIMFFIIAACAATLFNNGITNITSAVEAALALRPFAGNFAFALFALGILGAGLFAIPVLAGSASYAISESFGWKTGLYRKLKQAMAFYGVIIIRDVHRLVFKFHRIGSD